MIARLIRVHRDAFIHLYLTRRLDQSEREIRFSNSTPKTNRKLLAIEALRPVVTLVPLVA
jgi:hypothetical protein